MMFVVLEAVNPFPLALLEAGAPSPRVTSREGLPLLATVGRDDQWRIPVPLAEIDPRIVEATIAVEDERFHLHAGVDPLSILRATAQNARAGEVVSGASTITMQLCRLLHPRPRTLRSKVIETVRALQLERQIGKGRILEEYLNRAPYGGNVIGIEAAARRYFGKGADAVSLAEAALLAGLPQGPSILRPDRHPTRAKKRRQIVLDRMRAEGFISTEECRRAQLEPVILATAATSSHGLSARTSLAPHAAWWALALDPAGGRTTIDLAAQATVSETLSRLDGLPDATEVAAVVIEIETGAIRALIGSRDFTDRDTGWVSGATARRSPGSTLKPFIYARAFALGRLAPDSQVPDQPIERAGWRPENFDGRFRGRVSVEVALLDSLNVPAILVAEAIGLPEVARTVEAVGIDLPPDPERRGGLAVVTGALEVTLVDLVAGYATLGRRGVPLAPTIWEREVERRARPRLVELGSDLVSSVLSSGDQSHAVFPAEACAAIDAILAMRGGSAPDAPWWMAKTGTSARHREAWAVGHNGRYAIGVWVGRMRGGGDPSLVGGRVAMPILERLFCDPTFAVHGAPPDSPAIVVTRPYRFPAPDDRLRIAHPEAGGTWISIDDSPVRLFPRAEGGKPPYTWFLDGRVPATAIAANHSTLSIECEPGEHELRVIDADGTVEVQRFSIRGGSVPRVR